MITTETTRYKFHCSKIGNKLISVIYDKEKRRANGGFIHTLQNFNAKITEMFNNDLITFDELMSAASNAKGQNDLQPSKEVMIITHR